MVASIPGRFLGNEKQQWGLGRIQYLLFSCLDSSSLTLEDVIACQFSSIGSLGANDSWVQQQFGKALRSPKEAFNKPKLKLVYPTRKQVEESLEGIIAGGSLPFSSENYVKQRAWMYPLLCKWNAIHAGRNHAMPHIKTYARFRMLEPVEMPKNEESSVEFVWFMMTSANLSKAAWGQNEKQGSQLMIRSYELGVLACPEYFKESDGEEVRLLGATFDHLRPKCAVDTEKSALKIVPIRVAYDFPLTPYNMEENDECWTW